MSVAIGLGVALLLCIGFTLIAGRICHMSDLEKEPIDWWRS